MKYPHTLFYESRCCYFHMQILVGEREKERESINTIGKWHNMCRRKGTVKEQKKLNHLTKYLDI